MIKTRCKNLTDGSRIAIDKFVNTLTPYTFDELVSNDKIFAELFPNSDIAYIDKDIHGGINCFEIEIDDYIFSFFRRSDVEGIADNTIIINDTVSISKTVTVWVSESGSDFECYGQIKYDGKAYYLTIEVDVL